MSLRVWLPLTKDLRNQGLSNVTITNNGATYSSTEGKLGGCYTFDGNDYIRISMPSEMTTLKGTSVAAWVKSTSSTLALGGISNDVNYTVPMCTLYTSGWQFGNDAQNGYRYVSGGTIANTSTWHHVCCTVSDTTITTYLDGAQVTSGAISGVTTFTSANFIEIGCDHPGGDEYLTGSVNDFRVYDHCLSPMEIKELSKGLVLHYPLNRGGWGQENLLLNTNTPAIWSQGVNSSNYAVHDCFKTQSPVPSLFSVDELITISFDWSTTATGGNFHIECGAATPWVWGTIISSKGTRNSASNYIDISSSNQSGHVEITFKITSAQTGAAKTLQWLRIRHDGADTANKTFTISNAKLERGSIATPWCPNSSDALATTMGLNGTTEYDCSGFCNNGTRINFPQQNLLIGSDFSSQYTSDLVTNNSTDWTKYIRGYNSNTLHAFANGEDTVTLSTASNLGICFARKATDINLDPNSYYTLSCEAKSTQTTKPLCIGLSYYNNSNTWVWRGGSNPTNFTTANTWQKFSLTFKPDADTQYICYCFTVVGVANGTDTFTIRHCKLEKGTNATPWVNGESDNWTSDTPKYSVSTEFSNNRIQCNGNFLEGLTTATLSAWVKLKSYHSERCMVIFANGRYLTVNSSGQLSGYSYGKTPAGYYNSTKTIPLNTWTHITIVWSDITWYFYINGELVNSWSCTGTFTNSGRYISIGQESNGGRSVNGQISDARVYATALSADDVKSLYQNCATIDPDGTIRGQIRS